MPYDNVNKFVDELFESLLSRYQNGLETSIRGIDFISYSVQLLYYKCHKINCECHGSYFHSPGWIKRKKHNKFKNDDDKCFQYVKKKLH